MVIIYNDYRDVIKEGDTVRIDPYYRNTVSYRLHPLDMSAEYTVDYVSVFTRTAAIRNNDTLVLHDNYMSVRDLLKVVNEEKGTGREVTIDEFIKHCNVS